MWRHVIKTHLEQPFPFNPVSTGVGDIIRQSEYSVGIDPSKQSGNGSVLVDLLLPILFTLSLFNENDISIQFIHLNF